MNTQTTNLQLLLADYQINKAFKSKHALKAEKRFNKIVKALKDNMLYHLDIISNTKDNALIKNCLENLNQANSHTDKLANVTILFMLLLNSAGQVSSFIEDLTKDISKHV